MGQHVTRPQQAPDGAGECVGTVRAAQMLGVTDRTVIRWADDGTLPVAYRTAGGHRRFRVADIEQRRANPTER